MTETPSSSTSEQVHTEINAEISSPYGYHVNIRKIVKKRWRWCHRRCSVFEKLACKEKNDDRSLRVATCFNDTERVKALLESGVDPNVGDRHGRTALHIACAKGYAEIVKILLEYNADCNIMDKLGNSPLHLAVCTDSTETVNLLLEAGCSVSSVGVHGCTPLKLAQSKLRILQRHTSQDYNTLKSQVSEVIEMMKKLVEKESQEAELVLAFSSRLNLSQTSNEVTDDVKQLLHVLDNLHLNKPFLRPSKLNNVTERPSSAPVLQDSLTQLEALTLAHSSKS